MDFRTKRQRKDSDDSETEPDNDVCEGAIQRPPSPTDFIENSEEMDTFELEPDESYKSLSEYDLHREITAPQELEQELLPNPHDLTLEDFSRPDTPEADQASPGLSSDSWQTENYENDYEDYLGEDIESDGEVDCKDVDETEPFLHFNPDNDPPVYEGASISLHESFVSILALALRFSLSGKCIQAILKLVELHCLKEGSVFRSSLYLFKKHFSHMKGRLDYEYYCSLCYSKCEKSVGCLSCTKKISLSCLIRMPLDSQLQNLFKRKDFYNKLHFSQGRPTPSTMKDIYDGKLYQDHVNRGLLDKDGNLSFMWYTDGASLFHSSNISIWPFTLAINELPYNERYRKENLLVSALWCGPVQPHGNLLLDAAYPDLQRLSVGIPMEVEGFGQKTITGIVLSGTADGPARALMLHMVKHNGEHACQKCEQRGEPREDYPMVRVFPYRPLEMVPRTDDSIIRQGDLAQRMSRAYMGMKGQTGLTKILLNTVEGTALDAMHLVYGGVGKANLKFFNDPDFKNLKCNMNNEQKLILDKRLLGIKPPFYITRVPKSITDFAAWKTSQLKSMLLYYFALPVLKGLIPDYNFRHYASLVAAIQLLNSDDISQDCLSKADQLMKKYVSYFEDLYGRNNMTLSVHYLLHLVQVVQELSALWVSACFPLEGVLGEILKLVHGSTHAEMQIASSLQMCLGLEDLVCSLKESPSKEFCSKLLCTTNTCKSTVIGPFTILGRWERIQNPPEYLQRASTDTSLTTHKLTKFSSLRFNKNLFVVEAKSLARDSSCVIYNSSDVGIIKLFVRHAECECEYCCCSCDLYAVVEKLKCGGSFETLLDGLDVPNIHSYQRLDEYIIVPAACLKSVCVKMIVDGCLYVAKQCNKYEVE